METFTWKSHGEIKYTSDKKNTIVELGNGNAQTQRTRIHPVVSWEFTVSDTVNSLAPLQAFHDARFGGVENFLWTDKTGTQHTVKFMNDTQEITQTIGYNDAGMLGIIAYSTTVTLRKVFP